MVVLKLIKILSRVPLAVINLEHASVTYTAFRYGTSSIWGERHRGVFLQKLNSVNGKKLCSGLQVVTA